MYPTNNKFAHLRQVPYKIPAQTSFPNIQSTSHVSHYCRPNMYVGTTMLKHKPTVDPDINSNALSLALYSSRVRDSQFRRSQHLEQQAPYYE
jgi:hypothetical protein